MARRLIAALLLCTVPLAANSFCSGTFEVGGAALYLKPTACEFPFAIANSRPFVDRQTNNARLPQRKHLEVDTDYEWGFRVLLGYVFDCYDLRLVYSRVHSEDTHKRRGPFWPSFAHPRYEGLVNGTGANSDVLFAQSPFFSDSMKVAEVRSRVDFEYDAIDLYFACRSRKDHCLEVRSYLGLHLADILHRFRADYTGVLEPEETITANASTCIRFKDCSWGIGPLVGTEGRYEVGCGFGITGKAALGILAGERDGNLFAEDIREWMGVDAPEDVSEMLFFHMEERALLIPLIRVGFGIDYRFCLCRFPGVLELAYEFHSYVNALHTFRFNDQRATGMADCQSFDLNGLTLSLRFML